MSNRLFSVELNAQKGESQGRNHENDDRKVVIRFYGSSFIPNDVLTSSKSSEVTESRLVSKLSELNLCPKLLATFPGGRIEPFVKGRMVTIQELRENVELNIQIARKIALIHSLSSRGEFLEEIGIDSSRILFTSNVLDGYLADFLKVKSELMETMVDEDCISLFNHDFQSETDFLIEKFQKLESRIVFCHNDLHHKNIYLLDCDQNNNVIPADDLETRLMVMDYEYASFNYRWADLATYFTGKQLNFPSNDRIKNESQQKFNFMHLMVKRFQAPFRMSFEKGSSNATWKNGQN